jgi:hypothetical protein
VIGGWSLKQNSGCEFIIPFVQFFTTLFFTLAVGWLISEQIN